MPLFLFLLTAVTLSFIAWQDFRSRAVTWMLFPLLAGCGLGLTYRELDSLSVQAGYGAINSAFLLLQFALLRVWFFVRKKGKVPFIDHVIGKGDLFFLLAAGLFFSPVNFICFYLLSLLLALLWFRAATIPLAGLQAGFLLLCLSAHLLLKWPLTDDTWITLKLIPS